MDTPHHLRLAQILNETRETKELVHLAWREEVVWQAKHRKVVAKEETLMNLIEKLENTLRQLIENEEYTLENPKLRKEMISLLRDNVVLIKKEVEIMRTLLHSLAEAHRNETKHNEGADVEFVKLEKALAHIKEMEDHMIQLA
ncbi:hypothetical protein HY641_01890 [Candidatus Woesearchaeota archaeon]|nr:hypothetical protein [Candidatus Woesearchaeota archaeon]